MNKLRKNHICMPSDWKALKMRWFWKFIGNNLLNNYNLPGQADNNEFEHVQRNRIVFATQSVGPVKRNRKWIKNSI